MLHPFVRDSLEQIMSARCSASPGKVSACALSRFSLANLSTLVVTILIALFSLTYAAKAAVPVTLPPSSKAQWKQAENQTMSLASLMAKYRQAEGADKAAGLKELVDQARTRQLLLGELVQTDPVGAMRTILPSTVREGMPEEVQVMLTQKQEMQGELEVLYEDYEDGRHRLRHILKTATGRIELQLPENAKAMQSGIRVRARGWLFKHGGETSGTLMLNDPMDSLELLADGATVSATTSSSTAFLPNTSGEQGVLVLMVNFQDNPTQPWTPQQAEEMVFGTVNDFYMENSYGQTWLSGDVYGYYTLPIDGVCNTYEIATQANLVATANGIDTSAYNRLIYLFPQIDNCGWSGMGTVGGNPSKAWINGTLDLRTVGHELGHNLGLQHAKKLECGVNAISGDCYTVEYGDSLDIMGSPGFTGNFNAFNKEQLGWLSGDLSAATGQIAVAETDGSYQIEPYETTPGNVPKALKILRGIDSITGQGLWYYLEYRQPLGFDTYLASYPAITKGVSFHIGTESDMNSSQWIDMTPASASSDWSDAVLSASNSYTDPDAGVTITTEWADTTGVGVNISFTGPSCIPSNPALSLSPAESPWMVAGSTSSYTATVTNQDSSGCSSSDFNIAAELPVGWVADSASLNLTPGSSDSVTISVTSADAATEGFYDIFVAVTNSNDPNYQNSGVVTYVVDAPIAPCVSVHPAISVSSSDSAPVEPGTPVIYSATVTNQDSSNCETSIFNVTASAPAGWDASTTSSVALAAGKSGTVNLTVTSEESAIQGAYEIGLNASNAADGNYSSSTTTTYNVAPPTPVCEPGNPMVSFSTDNSKQAPAGSTVQYTGTVTNQDSNDCAPSDFTVTTESPSGWSASTENVTIAPGSTTPVTVSITSAEEAAGDYYININAMNGADSSSKSSTMVHYLVTTPQNNAPLAADDNVLISEKVAITIDVLANDTDQDGDTLTITEVTQGAQGSVQIIGSGSLLYTPVKKFKSSDSFSYTISDGKDIATAQVSISLVKKNSR
ncbi:MAG: hypothetical protein ACI8PB_001812 [Desulforhopalus sp.]|jgi:hypothetical protein